MDALQAKACFIIAMLAGHEAHRISEMTNSSPQSDGEEKHLQPTPAEAAYQELNQQCLWSIAKLGCEGDGCAWRRLSKDWPPPSSQSCRRTDDYMLEHNGVDNLKIAVGVLNAKSVKYKDSCAGASLFNLHCARRQQQMIRAMKFIAKASSKADLMSGLNAQDKVDISSAYEESLDNVASTMGEDGALLVRLSYKMKEDRATKKNPKEAVQKIVELADKLLRGSAELKEQAREEIRQFVSKVPTPLMWQEDEAAEEENLKTAEQLNSEVGVSEVLDTLDVIAPDNVQDDESSSSLIEADSAALVANVMANTIAFVLVATLLVVVVVTAVMEVVAALIAWALLGILGCGAYAVGHDSAISKVRNEAGTSVAKIGFTGFSKCFLKVFAFPFVLIGKAAAATYNYFKPRESSLLQPSNVTISEHRSLSN